MHFSKHFTAVVIVFLGFLQFVSTANIVFLVYCASKSHNLAQWPLASALAEQGHNVTFISPWRQKSPSKITEIVPSSLVTLLDELTSQSFNVLHRASWGLSPPLFYIVDYFCYMTCDAMHSSPEFKDWVATSPEIDLIFSDTLLECSYGLAEKFEAKTALFMPSVLSMKSFEGFGIPPETNSIPPWDIPREVPLPFMSRFVNAFLPFWYRIMESISYPWYQQLFQRELGLKNARSLDEMRESTSLLFTTGDYITDFTRSLPPFVVKIQGLHVRKEFKPLSKDVEDFLSNGEFMFVSFGTVVKVHELPEDIINAFFKAFESFPKLKFIWKWDGGDLPKNSPKNVKYVTWVDQQDVLAHPKIKGFFTHAGRQSFQEALYHAVPTITFPAFADQDFNAIRSKDLGISITLDFADVTEGKISKAIHALVDDEKYKKRAEQISKLAKDVQIDPLENALWWVEFALRHTKEELDMLKPMARNLTWYQKRDFDVWAFALILGFIAWKLFYCIVKRILGRFCKTDVSPKRKIKKS